MIKMEINNSEIINVPLSNITFDCKYWTYVSERWPEAYLDFVTFFREQIVDDRSEIWELSPQRQERLIEKFGNKVAVYYENPSAFSWASGLIYEFFCRYTMQKGYLEEIKTIHCQGRFIPESLYLILPNKYKI